jgi:hypothetical protein
MRISFVSMVLSWALLSMALTSDWNALLPIAVASGALTLVWLAHVTVRPIQSMLADRPHNDARRGALKTLAKGVLAATLVSAFPWQAYALSGCGGWAGNSGCRLCSNDRLPPHRCERQDNNCRCYWCRSCGNDCGNQVC